MDSQTLPKGSSLSHRHHGRMLRHQTNDQAKQNEHHKGDDRGAQGKQETAKARLAIVLVEHPQGQQPQHNQDNVQRERKEGYRKASGNILHRKEQENTCHNTDYIQMLHDDVIIVCTRKDNTFLFIKKASDIIFVINTNIMTLRFEDSLSGIASYTQNSVFASKDLQITKKSLIFRSCYSA